MNKEYRTMVIVVFFVAIMTAVVIDLMVDEVAQSDEYPGDLLKGFILPSLYGMLILECIMICYGIVMMYMVQLKDGYIILTTHQYEAVDRSTTQSVSSLTIKQVLEILPKEEKL